MSTIRPPVVTGFGICDETVSSCTVEKKNASQMLWIVAAADVVLEEPHQKRPDRVDNRDQDERFEQPAAQNVVWMRRIPVEQNLQVMHRVHAPRMAEPPDDSVLIYRPTA